MYQANEDNVLFFMYYGVTNVIDDALINDSEICAGKTIGMIFDINRR